MLRNTYYSGTDLVEETCQALHNRLPPEWYLAARPEDSPVISGRARVGNVLKLSDPQGVTTSIVVDVKSRPVESRQVSVLADRWGRVLFPQARDLWGSDDDSILLLVAPFLGPSARDRLAEAGISFADSTGNIRLASARPAVFIETTGASRNPWRESQPLHSLRGNRSGRIVRAFLDYRPPFGTRELSLLTGNAPASVSRVADLLERDAIIQRERPRGSVTSVDWERLVRRWALDYKFSEANSFTPCLAARGVTALLDRLRGADFGYARDGILCGGPVRSGGGTQTGHHLPEERQGSY